MSTTGAKLSGSANSRISTLALALLGQDGGGPGWRASPGRWASYSLGSGSRLDADSAGSMGSP